MINKSPEKSESNFKKNRNHRAISLDGKDKEDG